MCKNTATDVLIIDVIEHYNARIDSTVISYFPFSLKRIQLMGERIIELENQFLMIRKMDSKASAIFCSSSPLHEELLNRNSMDSQALVLAVRDSCTVKLLGEWSVEIMSLNELAVLTSFIDLWESVCLPDVLGYEDELEKSDEEPFIADNKTYALLLMDDPVSLLSLILRAKQNKMNKALNYLLAFISNHESFWVSKFMISQVVNGAENKEPCKIYEASKAYGVSGSHFRNLCHEVFSCSPKRQLRKWRVASCILELVDHNDNISTIALNNGFSSSAHFSYEVRNLFGVTPKDFQKLEKLFHD